MLLRWLYKCPICNTIKGCAEEPTEDTRCILCNTKLADTDLHDITWNFCHCGSKKPTDRFECIGCRLPTDPF